MKPITWIHTADLHLDQPIKGWYESKEGALQRREDYRETFSRIVSAVRNINADFLFIAGDFLEHGFVQLATIRFIRKELEQIPNTNVFITPGNHDPYRSDSFYSADDLWPSNVHIFKGGWESLYYEDYDLTIVGRAFTEYVDYDWEPLNTIPTSDRNFMITHGTFFSQTHSKEKCPYFPIFEEELMRYPFDYVALGHIHKPSITVLDNPEKTHVCYPGSPEALNWKEVGERYIIKGELSEEGMHLETIPIHSRTYEKVNIDISDCRSREDILRDIHKELANYNEKSCFEVVLEGRYVSDLNLEREIYWLTQQLKLVGKFHISLVNKAKKDFDISFYRKEKGVVGLFVRRIEERMREYPEKTEEYELALYKGLEAILGEGQG